MNDDELQRQQRALADQIKARTSRDLQKSIRSLQIAAQKQGKNLSWQQAKLEVQQQKQDAVKAAADALANAQPNFANDPHGFLGVPQTISPPPPAVQPTPDPLPAGLAGVPIPTSAVNLGGTSTDDSGSYAFVLVEGQAPVARRLLTTVDSFIDLTQTDLEITISLRPADDDSDYLLKSSEGSVSWDGPPDESSDYILKVTDGTLTWYPPPDSSTYVLTASEGTVTWGPPPSTIPDPPDSGDYVLGSIDGVLSWQPVGSCPSCDT